MSHENKLKIGSLFSGVGGLDMAVEQFFDAETVWQCEFDPEPSKVLAARWPGVPNFGDVTKVKWTPDCPTCGESTGLYWRDAARNQRGYWCPTHEWWPLDIRFSDPDADRIPEPVDIACGGFPCQDVSLAGRRAGMVDGTRSGLWAHYRLAISKLQPSVVVIENVRGLMSAHGEAPHDEYLAAQADVTWWDRVLTLIDRKTEKHVEDKAYVARKRRERIRCARHLKRAVARREREDRLIQRAIAVVLRDLADLGFDAEWHGLPASDIGAPHGRFRVFILAYARGLRLDQRWSAASRQAQGGRASTVTSGRADTPVALFRTPAAAELDGGRRNPDRPGATMRLRDQIAEEQERGILLPTPVAQPSGNKPEEHLRKKPGRTVVTDLAIIVENGLLESGGRLLPTPSTTDGGDRTLSGEANAIRTNWGPYTPAVELWESITRTAPAPTLPDGKNGNHRLAAVFPEWMMGYPDGWITDVIGRNPAIKAAGNGVCPQQAFAALTVLWGRANEWIAAA